MQASPSLPTLISILSLGLAFLAVTPGALGAGQTSRAERTQTALNRSDTPWHLYGGIGTGYGWISGQGYSSSPSGTQIALSGTLAYEFPRWILDVGVGWMYTQISGVNSIGHEVSVKTRSGFAELSPRYRIGDHWQIGPVAQLAFGTDTSMAPSVLGEVGTLFAGGRLAYQFAPFRVYLQGVSDITTDNRRTLIGLLGFQFGFPIGAGSGREPAADEISIRQAARERQPRNEVRFVLDSRKVFFETNSAAVQSEAERALRKIGEFLKQDPGNWEALEVSGHADQRGRYQYNLQLSWKRAQSVVQAMGLGSARQKAAVRAFSYLKPLDPENTPGAWARNRRVELVFRNVRDLSPIRKELNALSDFTYKSALQNGAGSEPERKLLQPHSAMRSKD